MTITADIVHKTIGKYMITDGFDLVLDLEKSKGCQIYDARKNEYLLDGFSFFASAPLGCNPSELLDDTFQEKLGRLAVNKPTNSDLYTTELAEFVDRFGELAMPNDFKYLFFISGGALAVENGLKTAFDWKIRKNLNKGKGEKGTKIIHFQEAFHGRSGYTLSMTNTFNLNKIKYFPKFDWPRIINPKVKFPLNKTNIKEVIEKENLAYDQINKALEDNPDDIAAIIIEPIQGEGGDNHFRNDFFKHLFKLSRKYEFMYIVDEIQTGVGSTGRMWAYEHFNFTPDILAFGKKTQVCGIMVGSLIDEVKENVFHVSSRLNSTWGGNLVDMVRCQKYLEIIKEENLVKNSEIQGNLLLKGLQEIQENHPDLISNARGLGLMCAFDLETSTIRDDFRGRLYRNGLVVLGCGEKTIRFRPPLIVSSDEINEMIGIIEKTFKNVES
jgi:L-lysine 6-transaminase